MLSVYAIEKSEIYGHGKRVVIWFSGCSLHCKGCINSHLWNKDAGKRCSVEELFKEIFSIGDFFFFLLYNSFKGIRGST